MVVSYLLHLIRIIGKKQLKSLGLNLGRLNDDAVEVEHQEAFHRGILPVPGRARGPHAQSSMATETSE